MSKTPRRRPARMSPDGGSIMIIGFIIGGFFAYYVGGDAAVAVVIGLFIVLLVTIFWK